MNNSLFLVLFAFVMLCNVTVCTAQQKNALGRADESFSNDRFFQGSERDIGGGERFYYNNGGQQVGRSETQGGTERFYNSSGKYTGYTQQEFDRQQYYNDRGQYTGYSVRDGDIIRHYSAGGEYQGYTQQQDGVDLQFNTKTGFVGQSIDLNSPTPSTSSQDNIIELFEGKSR